MVKKKSNLSKSKEKKKYYLYYTCVDNLESIPCDEYKDQLKIIYSKDNTIIFSFISDSEEEQENNK